MSDAANEPNSTKMSVSIPDKNSLYAAYIPFVKGGGLFLPTTKIFQLGDVLDVTLELMQESTPLVFSGRVIWITPKGAEGNRVAGVGVQLLDTAGLQVQQKIETYLAGSSNTRQTHTL